MLGDEPSWAGSLAVLRVDLERGEQELMAGDLGGPMRGVGPEPDHVTFGLRPRKSTTVRRPPRGQLQSL